MISLSCWYSHNKHLSYLKWRYHVYAEKILSVTVLASWWRHQMEIFSALLALCAGNSPVSGEFPAQRPVKQSFDVFQFKRLSKHSRGWWFERLSRPLWRQCNDMSWHLVMRGHHRHNVDYKVTYVLYDNFGYRWYHSKGPARSWETQGLTWWRHQMEKKRITGHLCGEFTGHRWIPRTKANYAGFF